MNLIDEIKNAVIKGHSNAEAKYPPEMLGKLGVKEFVQKAIEEKVSISDILHAALIAGMDEVGKKFTAGEYFVPEMLLSAQAMKTGLKILEPLLVGEETKKNGTVILGTVKGDMHDIGKNLVGMMLEGGGFKIIDLGTNTPTEKFLQMAKENPEAVVGLSALLTTTRDNMRVVINELRSNGCSNKVIIGGAAASQKFADEIKADGFTRDAALTVPLVKQILGIPS